MLADGQLDRLALWLDECSIENLVAESGPAAGRRVWIALEEVVAPAPGIPSPSNAR